MTQHPVDADREPQFLLDWESARELEKTRYARIASVVLHVALVIALLSLPKSVTEPVTQAIARQITPLMAPFKDLTQTAPNRGKVSKEFDVAPEAPRPQVHIPSAPPPGRKLALPLEKKAAPAPAPAAAPAMPDAPKVDTAQQTPPANIPPVAPPPQIQPQEKPKLAFETPPPASGPGTGKLAKPSTSVQDALSAVTQGAAGGAIIIGDPGAISPSAIGGLNAPPVPGKPGASLELLSSPLGADFRPYLIQVLAKVKLYWFNVWPQSARMGRQGRVVIQFSIDRKGFVPKLVIASGSGTDALDHGAVAGISGAQPFPQFPTGFTGDQVRLQLNFVYNMR